MDVLALLDERGIAYVPRGGDEYAITCPNQSAHSKSVDTNPSFNINVEKHVGNCLACGYHLNEQGLYRFLYGDEVDEMLAQAIGLRSMLKRIESDTELFPAQAEEFSLLPPGKPWNEDYRDIPAEFYRLIGARHIISGFYRNRILFPIRINGQVRGFESRALGGEQPKYLRNKGFNALAEGIYPLDIVREMRPTELILCEGVFDSLNAVSKGYPALNIFGVKTFSLEKFSLILSTGCKEIVLFFDNDKAGNEADLEIHTIIKDWITVSRADKSLLVDGKDLGDLTAEEIRYSLERRTRM